MTSRKELFEKQGYLVIEGFVKDEEISSLKQRMDELLDELKTKNDAELGIFSTVNQDKLKDKDKYFLESSGNISFFFEEEAFESNDESKETTEPYSSSTPSGPLKLKQEKKKSINKVGHALHDLDPTFRKFTYSEKIFKLVTDELDIKNPKVVQSMYIFKQPNIGGKVVPHQDSTFIHTKPLSCVGLWFALEDATLNNGCLWVLPGSHLSSHPANGGIEDSSGNHDVSRRMVLTKDKTSIEFIPKENLVEGKWKEAEDSKQFIPVEVPKGTMVVLHGELVHLSYANRSDISRHAYTIHLVSGSCIYSEDNWLQRKDLPFRLMEDEVKSR